MERSKVQITTEFLSCRPSPFCPSSPGRSSVTVWTWHKDKLMIIRMTAKTIWTVSHTILQYSIALFLEIRPTSPSNADKIHSSKRYNISWMIIAGTLWTYNKSMAKVSVSDFIAFFLKTIHCILIYHAWVFLPVLRNSSSCLSLTKLEKKLALAYNLII